MMREPPASLHKKLGVAPSSTMCILGDGAPWLTESLPPGVDVRRRLTGRKVDLVVLFCRDTSAMIRRVGACAQAVYPSGAVWVAWPRRSAGHSSDLSDNSIRAAWLPAGLVDVKVAALCEDWSGLKFVWRKDLREPPGER